MSERDLIEDLLLPQGFDTARTVQLGCNDLQPRRSSSRIRLPAAIDIEPTDSAPTDIFPVAQDPAELPPIPAEVERTPLTFPLVLVALSLASLALGLFLAKLL